MSTTATETGTATEPAEVGAAPAAGPPPPVAGRPRQLLMGAYLASAAGAMAFATLIGAYFHFRDEVPGPEWPPPEIDYPNIAALTLTLGLLMSSATAAWIATSARRGDRRNMLVAIGITILLGLAHINGMTFVFDAMGVGVADSQFAVLFYALNATHLAVLGAALVMLVVTGFGALGGRFVSGDDEPVLAAVVLWQFMVVAWLAVYVVVFLNK